MAQCRVRPGGNQQQNGVEHFVTSAQKNSKVSMVFVLIAITVLALSVFAFTGMISHSLIGWKIVLLSGLAAVATTAYFLKGEETNVGEKVRVFVAMLMAEGYFVVVGLLGGLGIVAGTAFGWMLLGPMIVGAGLLALCCTGYCTVGKLGNNNSNAQQ